MLQSENDEYQAITLAGSGHFGYRNLISDFRALLIILAINSFNKVLLYSFFVSLKLIVCVTNFDHNPLLYWPFVGGVGVLYQWQDSMPHFLLCLYILQVVII